MIIRPLCLASVLAIFVLGSASAKDIGKVYWISDNCVRLADPVSVRITNGPPGITLSLRKGMVEATRQGCPNKIDGAFVVLKGDPKGSLVSYEVAYSNGLKSNHTFHP